MKKRVMKKPSLELILLIVIIIFALFLRLYALGGEPFWTDEAISSNAALEIKEKGTAQFDSGSIYSRAYVFHYVEAFFLLFGENEFLARLPSVIFGILTIVLGYFIGKEYSKKGGVIAALFLAVFFLEVSFSRQARFYQLFQLLFFATIYFMYKAKDNLKYLFLSIILLFLTINTQIQGVVIAPFMLFHLVSRTKHKYLALFPAIPIVTNIISFVRDKSSIIGRSFNFSPYFRFFTNSIYLFILFIPGAIISFVKRRYLTILIIGPAILALTALLFLNISALRYIYVIIFPVVLYFSLFLAYLFEKYGKIMIVLIVALLIIPSNLLFSEGVAVNVIKPQTKFLDLSAPVIDYKSVPIELKEKLKNTTAITYFSPSFEWYIKKPDYVIAFSLNGIGDDQVSYNNSKEIVDLYSGAPILKEKPEESYYFAISEFTKGKLKPHQEEELAQLIEGCILEYENPTLEIYYCEKL